MIDRNDGPDILARTLWGEARGEPENGRVAVGCVIRNRAHSPVAWWRRAAGVTDPFAAACLCAWQFSCWNDNDPNRRKIEALDPADPAFRQCRAIAEGIVDGTIADITDGATHYYAKAMKPAPQWAGKLHLTAAIGGHLFLKEL